MGRKGEKAEELEGRRKLTGLVLTPSQPHGVQTKLGIQSLARQPCALQVTAEHARVSQTQNKPVWSLP